MPIYRPFAEEVGHTSSLVFRCHVTVVNIDLISTFWNFGTSLINITSLHSSSECSSSKQLDDVRSPTSQCSSHQLSISREHKVARARLSAMPRQPMHVTVCHNTDTCGQHFLRCAALVEFNQDTRLSIQYNLGWARKCCQGWKSR